MRHGAAFAFYEGGKHGHGSARRAGWQHYGRGSRFASGSGHSGGGIQCVTFARADSGIELSGDARDWWGNAAGIYQRGSRPESGAVLNFRANGSMRLGHVAVVNHIVDSRTVEIDHANWGGPGAVRGGISRDISVVDVSPNNDWSAVRVGLGHSGEYGSIYPTFGFIYNRPDAGTMVMATNHATPVPDMNPPPRDLRPRVIDTSAYDEVAEAPDTESSPIRRPMQHATLRHHHVTVASSSHRHTATTTTKHRR
jgi:surface antigen